MSLNTFSTRIAAGLGLWLLVAAFSTWADGTRPRVVLMDDPELDDQNTVIRYLLYSNEFETEGLIYTSSAVHWAGDGHGTTGFNPDGEYRRFGLKLCPCISWRWKPGERFIDEAVEHYAEVYPQLKVHAKGYPSPAQLKSIIFTGNIQFDGDISNDSPGSRRIEALLLDDRPGPLYLLTGGGQSTIARALLSIQTKYEHTSEWPTIKHRISQKAIIQAFRDQDRTYERYIGPNWPDIEYRDLFTQIWGYGIRDVILPQDSIYISPAWTKTHVSNKGPLGAFYRVWGDGRQMVPGDIFDYFGLADLNTDELRARGYIVFAPPEKKGGWISEGDTSIFMNLIDNGLRGYESPSYGGWGGRNGIDHDQFGASPPDYAAARWFGAAQRDFAARLQWSVTRKYGDANHVPIVRVKGNLNRTAEPGERVELEAEGYDPDGDHLTYKWWQYVEAGSYSRHISLIPKNQGAAEFRMPDDILSNQTVHMIVEVKDDGYPSLTSYQRVIIRLNRSGLTGSRNLVH